MRSLWRRPFALAVIGILALTPALSPVGPFVTSAEASENPTCAGVLGTPSAVTVSEIESSFSITSGQLSSGTAPTSVGDLIPPKTYCVLDFKASSTWKPPGNLSVEYFLVGGGGGGGGGFIADNLPSGGGGGGGGGLARGLGLDVFSSDTVSIVVGAGAPDALGGTRGGAGESSSLSINNVEKIRAGGGGGGGSTDTQGLPGVQGINLAGATAHSGGGGGSTVASTATPLPGGEGGQPGGSGLWDTVIGGGGGGGAGAEKGINARRPSNSEILGGDGSRALFTRVLQDTTVIQVSGGGGGGSPVNASIFGGGARGGGFDDTRFDGFSAVANTGGGGGGGSVKPADNSLGKGGAGGSGRVIVRFELVTSATLVLNPNPILANGTSTSEVTVTLEYGGNPVTGAVEENAADKLTLETTRGSIGGITETDSPGVYTATLTSPTTLDDATVTAKVGGSVVKTATLGFTPDAALATDRYLDFDGTFHLQNLNVGNKDNALYSLRGGGYIIEAWVYDSSTNPDGSAKAKGEYGILRLGTTSPNRLHLRTIYQGPGNNRVRVGLNANSSSLPNERTTDISLPQDQWVHVALKRLPGDLWRLYFDGVQVLETSAGGQAAQELSPPLRIGTSGTTGGTQWIGGIDQVKIWQYGQSGDPNPDSTARLAVANYVTTSMHTYSDAGKPAASALRFHYDFNAINDASVADTVVVFGKDSVLTTSPSTALTSRFVDVKEESVVNGRQVIRFPRSYLTAYGGWIPPSSAPSSVDYLVVAGGGAGGGRPGSFWNNGGGGAGGFQESSLTGVTAGQPLRVTVGQGGVGVLAGPSSTPQRPSSGQNSTLGSITSLGGAFGGGESLSVPTDTARGSGGGGNSQQLLGAPTDTATSGQGFNGGNAIANTTTVNLQAAGGGGGAGAAGGNAASSGSAIFAGAGGAGKESLITGSSVFYAGGGGGGKRSSSSGAAGVGGVGGGGDGGQNAPGRSAVPSTGGGGGGGGDNGGGHGGSGIVIVGWELFSPPVIGTQPTNQSKLEEESATFTVVATASGTLSYQWQRSDDGGARWDKVVGATAPSLTLTNLTLAQDGQQYRVIVTNTVGSDKASVASDAAFLTVKSALPPIVAGARCDGGYERAGIRVSAGHGEVFYIDTGQGQEIDAGYLAYRVGSTSARSDLWVEVTGLTGGVISLANPSQGVLPLGAVTAGGSGTAYFMIKATGATTVPQAHRVRVYDQKPTIGAPLPLYECSFSFVEVQETIKAAANKVDSITSTAVARIGATMTITVDGDTGTIGQGNKIDGRMIYLTPVARSDWPTQALRLESTSISFFSNAARTSLLSAHNDVLRVNADSDPALTGTSRQYYRATYTFRVIGSAASTAPIIPIAMISSGTQIKHTDVGSLPSGGATTVDLTDPQIDVTLVKDVDTTTAVAADGSTTVTYTMTLTNRGVDALVVDEIIDTPDTKLTFVKGTAKLGGVAIRDPGITGGNQLGFSGPFTLSAGQTRILTYDMRAVTCAPGGTYEFKNTATARIGEVIVGSSSATRSLVTLTGACGEEEAEKTVVDELLPPDALTGPANDVTTTEAKITGTIDSNGTGGLAVTFRLSTNPDPSGATPQTATPGTTTTSTSPTGHVVALTGLTANTTYYYRIEVGTGGSTVVGETLSFRTDQVTPTSPVPTATTEPPRSITTTSAILMGAVKPDGVTGGAKVLFEWEVTATCAANQSTLAAGGFTSGFLQEESVPSTTVDALYTGLAPVEVSFAATSLATGTGHCYRVVAQHGDNFGTRVVGNWVPFTTVAQLQQAITWSSASSDADLVLPAGGTLTVTATASSGLAVNYTSVDESICTVDQTTGVVTAVATSGTCVITATQSGGTSGVNVYEAAVPSTISFPISRPTVTTTTLADLTYGSPSTRLLGATGGSGTYTTWAVTGLPAGMTLNTATGAISGTPTVAGSFTLVVTVEDSLDATSAERTITLFVGKALLTVTAASITTAYGAPVPAITPTYSGFVLGDGASKVTTPPTCATNYTVGTAAGTLGLTTSCRDGFSDVYTLVHTPGTLTVEKLTLTITALDAAKKANDPDPTFGYSFAPSLPAGQTIADVLATGVTFTRAPGETAGDYSITPAATPTSNYLLDLQTGTLTIEPVKPVPTIAISDSEIEFGTTLAGLLDATASSGGTSTPGTFTYTTPGGGTVAESDTLPAGQHSVTVRFVPTDGNTFYGAGINEVVSATFTVTVTPAVKTVTAADKEKRAGGLDPALTFVASVTPADGQTGPVSVSRAPGQTPGQYAITTSGASHPSYVTQHVPGKLYIYDLSIGTTPATGSTVSSRTITGTCAGLEPGSTAQLVLLGATRDDDIVLATTIVPASGPCALTGQLPNEGGLYEVELRGRSPLGNNVTDARTLTLRLDLLITPASLPGGGGGGGGGGPVVPFVTPLLPGFQGPPAFVVTPPVVPGGTPGSGGQGPSGTAPLRPPSSGLLNTFTDQAPRLPGQFGGPGGVAGNGGGLGAGGLTLDFGAGIVAGNDANGGAPAGSSPAGSSGPGVRSVAQMGQEKLGGFSPPGSSTLVEILGARTGARFVVTETTAIDTFALIRAIQASVPTQAADFFALAEVRVGEKPQPPALWSSAQRNQVNEFFAASGLDAPLSLADINLDRFSNWVVVTGSAQTYAPGTVVYLTVTSQPLVISSAVVDDRGYVEIAGAFPADWLEAGEHRIRLVGIRALEGVSVDDQGEVQLSDALMAEIQRFDLGTQATIAVVGSNESGGTHTALRVVPLVPVAPWWTLWFIALGFAVVAGARYRRVLDTKGKQAAGAAVVAVSAVPSVVLGWLSTVTGVVWWGLALGLVASVASWLMPQRSEEKPLARRTATSKTASSGR